MKGGTGGAQKREGMARGPDRVIRKGRMCSKRGGEGLIGTERQGTEEEILRRANEWMEAVRQKDIEALESMLAREYMLQAPGIGRMPRDQWLGAIDVYDIRSFEFDDVQVHIYESTAVMRSRYTQEATYQGGDRSAEFLVTDVWNRRDGRWQVVTRHTSV